MGSFYEVNVRNLAHNTVSTIKMEEGVTFENKSCRYTMQENGELLIFDKRTNETTIGDSITVTDYQSRTLMSVMDNTDDLNGESVLSRNVIQKSIEQSKNNELAADLSQNVKNGYAVKNAKAFEAENKFSAYVTNGNRNQSAVVSFEYNVRQQQTIFNDITKKEEKSIKKKKEEKPIKKKNENLNPEEIAATIKNDLYETKWFGLSKKTLDLSFDIYKINPDNVLQVMEAYSSIVGEESNLFSDIMGRSSISYSRRANYLLYIKNVLMEHYKSKGVYVDDLSAQFDLELNYQRKKIGAANADYLNVFIDTLRRRAEASKVQRNTASNGEIDTNFKQGRMGDCWLLASVIAINNTPRGHEILDEIINVNEDGSISVHLKGPDKTYVVTQEELQNNVQYSTGDLDVRAIEIAFTKYFYEERGVNNKLDINGNYMFIAYEILLGQSIDDSDYYEINSEYFEQNPDTKLTQEDLGIRCPQKVKITDEHIDRFNNVDENTIVTVASSKPNDLIIELSNGKVLKIIKSHAYAVARVDSKNVYLINPHDTSKTLPVPREDFKNYFTQWHEITL